MRIKKSQLALNYKKMIKKNRTDSGANEVVGTLFLIGITVVFGTMVGSFVVSQVSSVPENPDAKVSGMINESENTVNFTVEKLFADKVIFRAEKDCSGEKSVTVDGGTTSFNLPTTSGSTCRVTAVAEQKGTERTVEVFEKTVS